MICSVALHIALVIMLITHPASKGVRKPQVKTTVVISLEPFRDSGDPKAAHVEIAPPKPVPKTVAVPPPDARPVAKPKPVPVPPRPAHTTTAPQPKAQAQAPSAQPRPNEVPTADKKRGDEGESLGVSMLSRIRSNWLRPAGSSQSFRCRLRIDYLAGGYIANVVVLEGCGTNPLDDSVERAVWKTQPLPLAPSQNGPGSLVLEFTP